MSPISYPPSCQLLVNGVRYNDGCMGAAETDPVVLDELKVTWGRRSNIDQPSPATISFKVLDEEGGQRFLDQLHIGAQVDVVAEAIIYPDPDVSTIVDSGFELSGGPSPILFNCTIAVSTARAHGGTKSLRIDPVDPTRAYRVIFPPDDFGGVSAWDSIPRTLPGQTWTIGAAVWPAWEISAVQRVAVQPVAFQTSTTSGAWGIMNDAAQSGPGTGAWQVLEAEVVPPAGVWLGVAVTVWPTGPTWQDVPADLSWNELANPGPTWGDLAAVWVDDLTVLAPDEGAVRAGNVANGRITDLEAYFDSGMNATVVEVIAMSAEAELANRFISDAPWAVGGLEDRFAGIVAASGQTISWNVDPTVADVLVTYRDVDNQQTLQLLQELATSVGGVLWGAASLTSGPFLWLEDVDNRPALSVLRMGVGDLVQVEPADDEFNGAVLRACDLLLDPVRWHQTSEDDSTRVALQWQEQTTSPTAPFGPAPTSRTITAVDAAREQLTGSRRVQVSTQLAYEPDAIRVANNILAKVSSDGWRINGLTMRFDDESDLDAEQLNLVMRLLDGVTRLGCPLMLTELPSWSPISTANDTPLYLEGGTYTNVAGAWTLELVTSSGISQGGAWVNWDDLPEAWGWDDLDPTLSWNDLQGVGI